MTGVQTCALPIFYYLVAFEDVSVEEEETVSVSDEDVSVEEEKDESSKEDTLKCDNCGYELSENNKFCPNCGESINADEE